MESRIPNRLKVLRVFMAFGVLLLSLAACRQPAVLIEERYAPDESVESYRRALAGLGIDATRLGQAWLRAADPWQGLPSLSLLPLLELRYFPAEEPGAAYYLFEAVRGQRVEIDLDAEPGLSYFADLFGVTAEAAVLEELLRAGRLPSAGQAELDQAASAWFVDSDQSLRTGASRLVFEPRQTRFFVLRVLPRLLEGGTLRVSIVSQPSLSVWPVEGTGLSAIRSFFGDGRDGDSRVHHGVDIFAPRGTPILAPVDGRISRIGERPLGGQTVTMIGSGSGLIFYFAHLDSYAEDIAVGQEVSAGQVLGRVGNTGNAITTPPHLHFGIYDQTWRQPVDPWYFLVSAGQVDKAATFARMEAWLTDQSLELGLQTAVPVVYKQPPSRNPLAHSPARRDGQGRPLVVENRHLQRLDWREGQALDEVTTAQLVAVRDGALGLRLPDGSTYWSPGIAN